MREGLDRRTYRRTCFVPRMETRRDDEITLNQVLGKKKRKKKYATEIEHVRKFRLFTPATLCVLSGLVAQS